MQATDESFHSNFLKLMFLGFKIGVPSPKKMSCRERKNAIKVSANIAMALASKDRNWSRALIFRHAKHEHSRLLVRSLLGTKRYESIMRSRDRRASVTRRGSNASRTGATARVIATSMVKKRTRILKRLVPGGESLDDLTLLGETIDYIISLQAQVSLMRMLTEVLGVSDLSPQAKGAIIP